jgi:hypothetical protein
MECTSWADGARHSISLLLLVILILGIGYLTVRFFK